MLDPYIYDKLAQAHHQELLQEAEQQRMLAQLPRRHPQLIQNIAQHFVAFLMNLLHQKVQHTERTATGQL